MKKFSVILSMILLLTCSAAMAKTLCIKLWQNDAYVSYPPITQAYTEKLKAEGVVVNVFFENIYNRKTTNYDIVVRTLDAHKQIGIKKFEFEFDDTIVKVDVNKSFELYNYFDDHTFKELPPYYFNCFNEEITKQQIDFQEMFKSHLNENEKFPVKVSIFYTLDDEAEMHKVSYDFEASTYEFKNVSPLYWLVPWF